MTNFHWKLCTIIYNFLFCCFTVVDLQFQVTLQQNQKLIDGVSVILFMYKICTYCLSKAHLGVLNAVAYAENFHGGGFIQWHLGSHMYLVCAVCDVTK